VLGVELLAIREFFVRAHMKLLFITLSALILATLTFAVEAAWKTTLRTELHGASSNIYCHIPFNASMRIHYVVPMTAAKILENRSSTELLLFLSELQATSKPPEAGIAKQWHTIVDRGLRGTPSTNISVSGTSTQVFETFVYSYHPNEAKTPKP
jgi:hypothetical protein